MSSLGVWDILKSPVITEKSVILKEDSTEENDTRKQGQVLTFRVDKKANKIAIKAAVEEIFNVKVAAVRTIQYDGKVKKRGRIEGRRPGFKKGIRNPQKGRADG
ncbi:MAG: 50S ribosomal protein L23 [Chloracidobacterium sp.]|nr:50S ribosomal protein L23 [Chloracidobacterium sp.]